MTTNPRAGAPPGKQNGRPLPGSDRPNACSTSTTNSLTELVATAQQLVTQIGNQAAADDALFRTAYRLGHDAGWQIGYRRAYHEIAEQDRLRMARMHDIATTPAYAELERIRWDGRREDFGKPRPGDFKGFGATYEPPSTSDRARDEREAA